MDVLTLGDKIKLARKSKRMTQKELARLTNVSRVCVANWEQNLYKPGLDNYLKIKQILEIDL